MQPNGPPQTSLIEIGPRFVLTPIRIFEGAFSGATVYSNPGQYSLLVLVFLFSPVLTTLPQNLFRPPLYDRQSKGRKETSTGNENLWSRRERSARRIAGEQKTNLLCRKFSLEIPSIAMPIDFLQFDSV